MVNNNFIDIRLGDAKKDNSQVVEQSLIETTANIVGTSYKGPAFVPQKIFAFDEINDVDVYNTLEKTLGTSRQNQHAHLYDNYACYTDSMAYDAASAWLNNGGIYSSFTRVLGIGTGTKNSTTGKMINSGFNASNNISSGTLTQKRGPNLNANANGVAGNVTFFLKEFDEISVSSTAINADTTKSTTSVKKIDYLRELGSVSNFSNANNDFTYENNLTLSNSNIITNVVIFPSGVLPSLSSESNIDFNNNTASSYATNIFTIAQTSANDEDRYISLNGFYPQNNIDETSAYLKDELCDIANYTEKKQIYNSKVKNHFPDRLLEKGHLEYARFNFGGLCSSHSLHKVTAITAMPYSDVINNLSNEEKTVPDYNSFESEYTTAKTPWITSQPVNRDTFSTSTASVNRINIDKNVQDLFRFWSLSDGEVGNKYRIKINPVLKGTDSVETDFNRDAEENFATFDIYIFVYDPRDNTFDNVETYNNVNLHPDSPNYISRLIGDVSTRFDFDANCVVERGLFENKSNHVRVEVHESIENKSLKNQHRLIPSGFRSYPHISVKKNAFKNLFTTNNNLTLDNLNTLFDTQKVYQLPPLYSLNYYEEYAEPLINNIHNHWGVIFNRAKVENDKIIRYSERVEAKNISPHFYYSKYFLSGITGSESYKNIWVEQDNYLNSFFHLEKIMTKTDVNSNVELFRYRHSGRKPAGDGGINTYNYLNLDDNSIWEDNRQLNIVYRNKLSFDFFTYGGFDGVDIRDTDKRFLRNDAIARELFDENEVKSTYTSYEKAIDIAMDDANCAGDIFVMPGIKENLLIDKVIKKCEDDRRHFLIADIGGAASNRLISFNKIVVDSNNNTVTSGDAVKTSLGIMGKYNFIENDLSDYQINEVKISNNDTRFSLGTNISGDEKFYNYTDVLKKQYSYTISTWKGLDLRSRYIMPTFGDVIASSDNIEYKKQISSDSFVLGKMAQLISPRQSLNNTSLPALSPELGAVSYSLIDEENLSVRNLNFDILTRDLRNAAINIVYRDESNDLQLLSENTSYENRKSVFQLQSIVRTIQEIKKLIRIDVFTNDSLLEGGVLFTQNNSFKNVYDRFKIQLNTLLNNLKDAGYIQDYKLSIPNNTDPDTILDMQNYIIRGQIILQFGDSDIIRLSIDEVLSNLSLLSDTNQDSVLVLNI